MTNVSFLISKLYYSEESSIVMFDALEESLSEQDGSRSISSPLKTMKIKENDLATFSPNRNNCLKTPENMLGTEKDSHSDTTHQTNQVS